MVTFALLNVLRQNNFDYRDIDAFDLTPAMLVRFQQTLKDRAITRVQLRQAEVLALDALPTTWDRLRFDPVRFDAGIPTEAGTSSCPGRVARARGSKRAHADRDHSEGPRDKSSHRVVVAGGTLYERGTAARLSASRVSGSRISAIPFALLLAKPRKPCC